MQTESTAEHATTPDLPEYKKQEEVQGWEEVAELMAITDSRRPIRIH